MEFTRELYWNVGHGIATLVPMYLLAFAAVALLVRGFIKRRATYLRGAAPIDRVDQPLVRLRGALGDILSQRQVSRVLWPGLAHAALFWGFFLLLVGTTLVFIQADFTDPLFGWVFLTGNFYKLFSVTLDLAGAAAIVALALFMIRRYLMPPEDLPVSRDYLIMHLLLLVILITGFVIEGARMAVTELGRPVAAWSPVGLLFANVLVDMGEPALRNLHRGLWWFHFFCVLGFFIIIPYTKFRHIFTTSANYFFSDRGPTGKLASLDLEDEEREQFGATQVADLSWKDIFDGDACTLCKRCQDRCPAFATGKPLSPMKVVNQIQETAFAAPDDNLIDVVSRDVLWACTTCRACQEICPAAIEHVGKIVEMRRALVLMEGEFPDEATMAAMEQTEVNGNPLGSGFAARGDWAEGLPVKDASAGEAVDIIYFVGCYGSFDKRNIKVARSFVTLCEAAGVSVGIMGKQEKCCGEPMRKMGNEYLFQTLAMEMVELLNGSGCDTIVTTCPHCFTTLNKDYRDFGLTPRVVSAPVFLQELLNQGRLPVQPHPFTCTYHDSCYLGRHNDIYTPPRALIEAAGGTIVEMDKSGSESFCCGGGGGRIMAEENIGSRINNTRVAMAVATGAPVLAASCPFCLTMFEDGAKAVETASPPVPQDIIELLAERLKTAEA
jgi:Fe-S oxidoreductase/nitrate reductase gamma subunit